MLPPILNVYLAGKVSGQLTRSRSTCNYRCGCLCCVQNGKLLVVVVLGLKAVLHCQCRQSTLRSQQSAWHDVQHVWHRHDQVRVTHIIVIFTVFLTNG